MRPVRAIEDGSAATAVFNTDFYDMYPVTEICERFKDLAKIRVIFSREMKQIEVCIRPKGKENAERIMLEFCNHVLHFQVKGV